MKIATSRIVGPKLKRSVSSSERSPGGWALTVTFCSSSRLESWRLLAKVGIWVLKFFAVSPSNLTSFLNSPWTVSPVEEISFTFPSRTSRRKVGL
jgi:hypothetical protein